MKRTLSITALLVAASLPWGGPSGAVTITIEAETYSSYYDYANGVIQSMPLSGCSSGYVLFGLDASGEWVQYGLNLTQFGSFTARLVVRGDYGVPTSIRMEITPKNGGLTMAQMINFTGDGFG